MKWIECQEEHFEEAMRLYVRVTEHLEKTVNYPKWNDSHPGREDIADAIHHKELFACVTGGAMVGVTVLSEDPQGDYDAGEWSRSLRQGEYLVIHMLAVDPDFSGKGIGGFLVEQCILLARQRGYQAIRLDVVPDNIPAIRLYEKKGFRYAGTKDLGREIEEIPLFGLYEYNID